MWIYVAFMFFHQSLSIVLIISTPKTSIRSLLWLISVVSCLFLHPYLILTFPLIVCKMHQHIFSSVEHCIYPKYMLVVVDGMQRFININLLTLEFFLPFLTLLVHKFLSIAKHCNRISEITNLRNLPPCLLVFTWSVNCMEIAFFHWYSSHFENTEYQPCAASRSSLLRFSGNPKLSHLVYYCSCSAANLCSVCTDLVKSSLTLELTL